MSYEEFLGLPITQITQFAQIIKFKRENDIPFSEDELVMQEHFIRYTENLKLQEDKARLEYCYSLNPPPKKDKYK